MKGQKRSFSMDCAMPGHATDTAQPATAETDALQERVLQLEADVTALRAQQQDTPNASQESASANTGQTS